MSTLWQFLTSLFTEARPWVTIVPWEQGIRVRWGNRKRLLLPGMHFKWPFIDKIYKQSVRRRFSAVPPQNLMTRDQRVVTVSGSFGYVISDVELLYETLHHAEATLESEVQGVITEYVVSHDYAEITPGDLQSFVVANLEFSQYGISDPEFTLATFISVPTFRLLMGEPKDWTVGEVLNTRLAEGEMDN